MLTFSTICSNIPLYNSSNSTFASSTGTYTATASNTANTGISVTQNGDTVTIVDTTTTEIDYSPKYFSTTYFSSSELDTIGNATNLEINFKNEVNCYDFDLCSSSSLKKVTFSGPKITFSGLYTGSAPNLTDIIFLCPVTLRTNIYPTLTCTLKGNDNHITYFYGNSGSLVIDGRTTFDFTFGSSTPRYSIKNLTINAPVIFSKTNTFLNTDINTLHLNVDPVTAFTFKDGMSPFKNCTISHLYTNYVPTDTSKRFALAPDAESPLEIGDICFLNPNYNYFNLDLTNVTGYKGSPVYLYGYGGSSAYNAARTPVLSQSMYQEVSSNTFTYTNYMTKFQVEQTTLPSNVLLGKNETSKAVSFENLNVNGTFLDASNPTSNTTYSRKLVKKSTWDTSNQTDAQYQYGIYVPKEYNPDTDTQFAYTANGQTYTLLKGNTCNFDIGTHTYYIEAGGNFEKHTVTVSNSCIEKISSVTLNTSNIQVGNSLTNADVTVKVCYTNDTTEYTLSADEFTLENAQITKEGAENVVTVVVPRQGSGTPLSTTVTVNGYVDNVTGFEVECNITEKLAGTTFSVGNITLKNVTYGNPNKDTTETLQGGYSFMSNGAATNTIKIQPGVNKISVCYGDYVLKDAITITGYTAESFTTLCDYQTMYVGTSLFKSDVTLKNIIYNDTKQTKKSSVKDGSFDFVVNGEIVSNVTIHEGTNVIGICYDGKTIEDAITIQGIVYDLKNVKAEYVESYLVDGVPHAKIRITITHQDGTITSTEIDNLAFDSTYQFKTNQNNEAAIFYQGMEFAITDHLTTIDEVRYLGTSTDTSYQVADFYIAATYASGTQKNTETNPEIAADFSTSVTTMSQQKKIVSLAYKTDNTEKVTATVELDQSNQVVSVSMDSNGQTALPQPDVTGSPSPIPTIPTTGTPDVTSSPVVNDDKQSTTTPAVTNTPATGTSSPTTDSPALGTPVVAETTTPTISPTVSPTATPIVTPVKGKTYTVGNLKYKVTSVTKTKGTVTLTGYTKSSSKLRLPSTVTIGKHKMKVTAIATGAFKNCKALKGTVTIPTYVTSIGKKAFYKCKNITKLVVTSKVHTIGTSAFQYCTKLKAVNLYNCTVKKVGKKAFFNNHKNRKFNMYYGQMAYYKKLLKYKIHFN